MVAVAIWQIVCREPRSQKRGLTQQKRGTKLESVEDIEPLECTDHTPVKSMPPPHTNLQGSENVDIQVHSCSQVSW